MKKEIPLILLTAVGIESTVSDAKNILSLLCQILWAVYYNNPYFTFEDTEDREINFSK